MPNRKRNYRPSRCPNCGRRSLAAYCSHCGEKVELVKEWENKLPHASQRGTVKEQPAPHVISHPSSSRKGI